MHAQYFALLNLILKLKFCVEASLEFPFFNFPGLILFQSAFRKLDTNQSQSFRGNISVERLRRVGQLHGPGPASEGVPADEVQAGPGHLHLQEVWSGPGPQFYTLTGNP